jgi:hypothetical protein
VILRVHTRGLAAPHSYRAKLMVVSNGGIVEVPVRLDVAAIPFARQPLQGAMNPRDLAARMRSNPKPSVPLLESGEIARWFAANGWNYPVPGAPARGVAAVQQFFEYMGLSKPPPLALADATRHFECKAGDVVRGQITVRTDARKWVYAEVTSQASWLRVLTPLISGPQQAVATFEVDAGLMPDGEAHAASITIVGNAGQKLTAVVSAAVRRPATPLRTKRQASPVLIGALAGLVCRLLLAVPADLIARSGEGGLEYWLRPALAESGFLRSFVLSTWWIGAIAAVAVVRRSGGKWLDLICGAVSGSFAGLVGAATAGCLVPLLDAGPRALLARLATPGLPAREAEVLWISLAATCWGIGGAVLGSILGLCGSPGRAIVATLATPAAWLSRRGVSPYR